MEKELRQDFVVTPGLSARNFSIIPQDGIFK
jgi:hypothetical protein